MDIHTENNKLVKSFHPNKISMQDW